MCIRDRSYFVANPATGVSYFVANPVTGVSYFVANPASQSVISLLQSLDKHNIYITK